MDLSSPEVLLEVQYGVIEDLWIDLNRYPTREEVGEALLLRLEALSSDNVEFLKQ
jgi:hypothetical protein